MELLNDYLKEIYTQKFQEFKEQGIESIDDIEEEVALFCSDDPNIWDLSEDEYGDIFDGYKNNMIEYLKSLS